MKIKFITLLAIAAGLTIVSGTPEKEEKRKNRSEPGITAPFSKEWLKKFDKNKDGKLCEEEKKAAAEAVKKRRAGRKPEGQRAKLERKKGKKEGKKK